jgi:hypothetical protein
LNPYQIKNKTILCFALTWGMGHTTRLAALLKILSNNQNKLILLGSKQQIQYYERLNLGDVRIICKTPDIEYYRGFPLWLSVVLQLPSLFKMSNSDKKLAAFYAGKFSADLIVSDNRYGFYSSNIPSFLITHQVWPLFPFFRRMLHAWLEKKIYTRFKEIWVPDHEIESRRLSGALSETRNLANLRYIGWLSIYMHEDEEIVPKEKYDELWLLNGPANEQKKFFNEQMNRHSALPEHTEKRIVVCGTVPVEVKHQNITFHLSPSPGVIKMLLLESGKIYARIGYTTLMDAVCLDVLHKIYFSPTPGQAEQEYLFQHNKQRLVT